MCFECLTCLLIIVDAALPCLLSSSAGHDVKSLAINLATTLLFFLPFAIWFYPEQNQLSVGVVVGSFMVCLLLPPIGWRRPHPLSDDPNNRPYPRKDN
jgi:hypothetical protein